jgi:hypothetical protein
MALLGLGGRAAGQSMLERFTYDSLRLSGVQIDAGALWSDRLEPAFVTGLRIDWGFFAPRIRLLTGVSYTQSDVKGSEIATFEDRIRQFVIDPSGDDTVRVGTVQLSSVVFDLDLQYLLLAKPQSPVFIYAGAGLSVQFQNGKGPFVNGTFVEDALDVVVAGLNGTLAAEIPIARRFHLTLEGRGVLTSGQANASARAGLIYRIGGVP